MAVGHSTTLANVRNAWQTHNTKGVPIAVITETTASKIHNPQAKLRVQSPQAGTQTRQIMVMIVDNPIGKVPRYMDWMGWMRTGLMSSGYMVYRSAEITQKTAKRATFRTKKMTEIQYSQRALYGRVFNKTDTIPVPMLTENHLGC